MEEKVGGGDWSAEGGTGSEQSLRDREPECGYFFDTEREYGSEFHSMA